MFGQMQPSLLSHTSSSLCVDGDATGCFGIDLGSLDCIPNQRIAASSLDSCTFTHLIMWQQWKDLSNHQYNALNASWAFLNMNTLHALKTTCPKILREKGKWSIGAWGTESYWMTDGERYWQIFRRWTCPAKTQCARYDNSELGMGVPW